MWVAAGMLWDEPCLSPLKLPSPCGMEMPLQPFHPWLGFTLRLPHNCGATSKAHRNLWQQVKDKSALQPSLMLQHPEQPLPPASHTAQWDKVEMWDFLDDKMIGVLSKTSHSPSVPPQWSISAVQEREKDDEHCQSEGIVWETFWYQVYCYYFGFISFSEGSFGEFPLLNQGHNPSRYTNTEKNSWTKVSSLRIHKKSLQAALLPDKVINLRLFQPQQVALDFTAPIFPILNAIDHRSSTLSNMMDLCSFSCSPELLQIKKTLFNEVCCCGRTF